MAVTGISHVGSGVIVVAHSLSNSARCPCCGRESTQVHGHYRRRPFDLPWGGYTVRLSLTVRRFRCANPDCSRQTFAESFGSFLPRLARRTARASALLLQLAGSAGGEAGARLATSCALPVSADTLLRLLRRQAQPAPTRVLAIGVDELALSKGKSYATIIVNLHTHRPIDMLPGREAAAFADWLKARPQLQVISRDRSGAYAAAATSAAPQAVQVADRFHLLANASAAMAELLRLPAVVTEDHPQAAVPAVAAPESDSLSEQRRWQEVHELHRQGVGIRASARMLAISRITVRRLLAREEPPRNRTVNPRPGGLKAPMLQPYLSYLQGRRREGCTNACQLYRELVAMGYRGSRSKLGASLVPSANERNWSTSRHCAGCASSRQVSSSHRN